MNLTQEDRDALSFIRVRRALAKFGPHYTAQYERCREQRRIGDTQRAMARPQVRVESVTEFTA